MLQEYLVPLLLKLGVMASIASILARSSFFKSMLMEETRTLNQRLILSLWLAVVFGASVTTRLLDPSYRVADLGLEGSIIAGILGGYVTGLLSGVLISLPAVFAQEYMTMPLLAGIGVLGVVLRDLAPNPDEIWRFSFFDLSIYRFFKESKNYQRASFHLLFFAGVLVAEGLRRGMARFVEKDVFLLAPPAADLPQNVVVYLAAIFTVFVPLKIWNSTRNEK